ncbi:MAG: ABC transporter ATP-binding protein [Bacteroidales bacterium]|nr:ABC transporter ATP-binding protein [Bacteroidales bacterium]
MKSEPEIISVDKVLIGYDPGTVKEKILLPAISVGAAKGEMVSLIGPNGIGKSTLLRTIAGMQRPLGGEVRFSGRNVSAYSNNELARKISFVLTGSMVVSNISVFELVSLGRFPHTNWIGHLTRNDRYSIEEAVASVGLLPHMYDNVGQLSDGEKQRAMIARALAQDTEIIMLDEPTAFLDLPNRYELIYLLRELSVTKNKTVVFSTHDIHIALREADRIWLATGNGIQEGCPEDLALSGAFDSLFEESDLSFVQDEGVFVSPVRTRMTIKLEGEGLLLYWTERALNRLGIKARSDAVTPSVSIEASEGVAAWKYESSVVTKQFGDIFSLVNYMKSVLKGDN